ncbi:DUF4394 domain-containing protein [Pedobacter duraquae]|nr:DUF4394 domain-containing protein [Pedobacter duraquae]
MSKIAFGSTQYFQKSSHQKIQHQSISFTDPADTDEELSTEKMEFKDFMIDSLHAQLYFYVSKKAPKITLYFALPLTHLRIPIEPPRLILNYSISLFTHFNFLPMLNFKQAKFMALYALALIILISSCKKDRGNDADMIYPGPNQNFYALTSDNKLLFINAQNTSTITSTVTITGLQTGELLLGIDFRPATGQLYAAGSSSRIYVVDPKTGIARAIGTSAFTPILNGTAVAFDFNPTVDRIRLVTSAGQNLRLNPETGAVMITDGTINGVSNARVTSAAYTQNRAGAATTILYDIDVANDKLHKQDPPNDGKLVEVGSLGIDAEDAGGFDISPDGTTALAALSVGGKSGLFTIDLNSGKATKVGNFASQIIGLAIPTEPVAYAVSANNELLIFNPAAITPTPVIKAITGLQAGEIMLGIDMRPLNGQLFGIGNTSRIYAINASSGAATQIGTGQLTTLLSGTDIGIDFNPTVDRIRIVTNTGQNLRINPADATLTADVNLGITTERINGAAYTNNFAGATTTVLYDIDVAGSRLFKQDPPNAGTLVSVGALGVTITGANGFDIGGTSGLAYGIFTVSNVQKIYTVNLSTGAATAGATFPQPVRGFTLGLGF